MGSELPLARAMRHHFRERKNSLVLENKGQDPSRFHAKGNGRSCGHFLNTSWGNGA